MDEWPKTHCNLYKNEQLNKVNINLHVKPFTDISCGYCSFQAVVFLPFEICKLNTTASLNYFINDILLGQGEVSQVPAIPGCWNCLIFL